MRFLKVENTQPVISYLANQINYALNSKKTVLWLVPGGSGIDTACRVAQNLKPNPNLSYLTVSLTDERYGSPGHPDSNWQQLIEKGFKLPGASLVPVLQNNSLTETARQYANFLTERLETSDYSLALGGLGADGHIFGIKPGSPSVDDRQYVVGYEWDDYVRLTPTEKLLQKLDEIVIYANGQEKHEQLDRLDQELSPQEQPAQLLKRLKKVTLFNDFKGELV